jgi:glycine hydroxymethyltransferase
VDLGPQNLTGSEAERRLGKAGIVVNHNVIPFDTRPPAQGSGVRIGTPSITTRGANEDDVRAIARWIDRILKADDPAREAKSVRKDVAEFCRTHPIPA